MRIEARTVGGSIRLVVAGTRRLARYRDGREMEPQPSWIAARWRCQAINAELRRRERAANGLQTIKQTEGALR